MSKHYLEVENLLNDKNYERDDVFFTLEPLLLHLDSDDWKYIREIWSTKNSDWRARLVSAIDGASDLGFPKSDIDASILAGLAFDLLPSIQQFDRQCGLTILLSTLPATQPFIGETGLRTLAQVYQNHPDVRPELKRVSTNAGFSKELLNVMGVENWPK